MQTQLILNAFLCLTAFHGHIATAADDAIVGDWLTSDHLAKVHITKSEHDGHVTYEGALVWLSDPNDETGAPRHDALNPDKALQSRPVLGLTIVTGLLPDGESQWKNGSIYDPKSGKTYRCKASLDHDQLKLRGYIGISLLGRNDIWTRVSQ